MGQLKRAIDMLFDHGPLCADFFARNTHSLEFDKTVCYSAQNWDNCLDNCFRPNQKLRPRGRRSLTREQEVIVEMEKADRIPRGHLVKISAFAGTGKTETSLEHNLAVLDRHIQKCKEVKNPVIRARCMTLMVKL